MIQKLEADLEIVMLKKKINDLEDDMFKKEFVDNFKILREETMELKMTMARQEPKMQSEMMDKMFNDQIELSTGHTSDIPPYQVNPDMYKVSNIKNLIIQIYNNCCCSIAILKLVQRWMTLSIGESKNIQ